MAEISAQMVKDLRDQTGAKMMTCKKALEENKGDFEKAKEWLRKKNEVDAGKKLGRETKEGAIGQYVHAGGKIAVLTEVLCETDFVARNEEFQTLLKDLCMHIAAAAPEYLSREDIPEEVLEQERNIAREQVTGKPENVVEKIVEGKIDKWCEERVLLDQKFVKDDKLSVSQVIKQKAGKLGENLQLTRFIRWELGQD